MSIWSVNPVELVSFGAILMLLGMMLSTTIHSCPGYQRAPADLQLVELPNGEKMIFCREHWEESWSDRPGVIITPNMQHISLIETGKHLRCYTCLSKEEN